MRSIERGLFLEGCVESNDLIRVENREGCNPIIALRERGAAMSAEPGKGMGLPSRRIFE
jgi:hypothetical protein